MKGTSAEFFVIDTRYTGTELYIETHQEYGVAFGYNKINLNILSDNDLTNLPGLKLI